MKTFKWRSNVSQYLKWMEQKWDSEIFSPILEALAIGLEVSRVIASRRLEFLNQCLTISQSPEFTILYHYNIYKFPTALDGRNTWLYWIVRMLKWALVKQFIQIDRSDQLCPTLFAVGQNKYNQISPVRLFPGQSQEAIKPNCVYAYQQMARVLPRFSFSVGSFQRWWTKQ